VTATRRPRTAPRTVLFVSLSGWVAGPGRSLATVIAHLPPDLDAVLACPATGNLLDTVQERRRLGAHLLLPRRPGQRSDPLTRLRAVIVLAVWAVRHRRDLLAIHANGFSDLHVSALGALVSRRRIVVWLHGSETNPWDHLLGRLWRRLLAGQATYVAVSEVARARAVEAGLAEDADISILPNPIDPADVLAPVRVAVTDRDPSGVLAEIPPRAVCGYLGGERARKGFHQLPDLVDSLAGTGIFLVVCDAPGPSDDDADKAVWGRLLAAGPRRVFALGHVDDVRDVYAQVDLVVVLSRMESFSRVVAEAGLNSLPVVATDIAVHRALIGDNAAGVLFPVGDLDSAARAIRQLGDDPELRRMLGTEGRSRAAAFAPEVVVPGLLALYERQGRRASSAEERV